MPPAPPCASDIEAIERATLAAIPPQRLLERPGWLVAIDPGTVRRAHSAVPLRHEAPAGDVLPQIERDYRAAGLAPLFRIPKAEAFDALRAQLTAAGYRAATPTMTQVARTGDVAAAGDASRAALANGVEHDWAAVFLGEGFDPVDGASRLGLLQHGSDSVFASVRVQARVVAVGVGSFGQGWCGIHGMRTLPPFRGQGCAAAILAALAREAAGRGVARMFLQVEEANPAARALYGRAGFAPAWTCEYWRAA